MDRQVANAIGLGRTAWVGLEESFDYIGSGLETASGVKGKVSTVVQAGGFFRERRLLHNTE